MLLKILFCMCKSHIFAICFLVVMTDRLGTKNQKNKYCWEICSKLNVMFWLIITRRNFAFKKEICFSKNDICFDRFYNNKKGSSRTKPMREEQKTGIILCEYTAQLQWHKSYLVFYFDIIPAKHIVDACS